MFPLTNKSINFLSDFSKSQVKATQAGHPYGQPGGKKGLKNDQQINGFIKNMNKQLGVEDENTKACKATKMDALSNYIAENAEPLI